MFDEELGVILLAQVKLKVALDAPREERENDCVAYPVELVLDVAAQVNPVPRKEDELELEGADKLNFVVTPLGFDQAGPVSEKASVV